MVVKFAKVNGKMPVTLNGAVYYHGKLEYTIVNFLQCDWMPGTLCKPNLIFIVLHLWSKFRT